MAKRDTSNFIGDLGEAKALTQLLRTGASINALSHSDSGWDLHLHLPTTPQFVSDTDEKRTWALSGRTAHVQVKKQTSASKPKIGIGTARGWLAGTKSGVPTFLVVAKNGGLFYATPAAISDWLFYRRDRSDERECATGGLRGSDPEKTALRLHPLDPASIGRVLHVWSRYPNVMLELEGLDAARNDQLTVPLETAAEWIAEVAVGYLSATNGPIGEVESWWLRSRVSHLSASAQTALDWDNRYDSERFEQAVQHAITARQFSGSWDYGLAVGTYCAGSHPDEMLDAGCELLSTILSGLPTPTSASVTVTAIDA